MRVYGSSVRERELLIFNIYIAYSHYSKAYVMAPNAVHTYRRWRPAEFLILLEPHETEDPVRYYLKLQGSRSML